MCDFVCGTMSCAKLLHWSVIHYQMTFEWHSGRGLETSIQFPLHIIFTLRKIRSLSFCTIL